jgi:hypothetical protein
MDYIATPITRNRWRNPTPAFSIHCPSQDGWKSRAARLCEALNAYYSHRLQYVLSPGKFAKFEELYAAGWDANFISRELIALEQ